MGRTPTLLKTHNYIDCRIYDDKLTTYSINDIVTEMCNLGIIDVSENYAYGLDLENDVIKRKHYHIRGKTKIVTCRMKKLASGSIILSSVPTGQNSMMLTGKIPDVSRGDYLSYLGYVGKDKLLFSTCELDIKTAKEKYNIKIKRLKEKQIVNNEKEELNSYLIRKIKEDGKDVLFMGISDHQEIKSMIVSFALDNDKRYMLNRTNLMSYTVLFLGKECLVPPSLLVELIEGNV